MKIWRVALPLGGAALGFVVGGLVGAQFVPAGAGLEAGATVFLWAAGGALAGLVAGIWLATRNST